jgi:hypothetical protein
MTGIIIAFPEPLVVLKAQWDALDAQVAILVDYDSARADAISRRCVEIEDRMAELVPRSPAGAAAQLWLLRQWARDFEWNEPLEQLSEKLLVGLANIQAVARLREIAAEGRS